MGASLIRTWWAKVPSHMNTSNSIFSSEEENFLIKKEGKMTGTDCVYLHFISFMMNLTTMFHFGRTTVPLNSTSILIWFIRSSLLGRNPCPSSTNGAYFKKEQREVERVGSSLVPGVAPSLPLSPGQPSSSLHPILRAAPAPKIPASQHPWSLEFSPCS